MSVKRPALLLSFGLLAAVAIAVLGAQRWQRMKLQAEIAVLQLEAEELPRLEAENRRLQSRKIGGRDLEQLQADHAALPRLRAEVEALKVRVKAAGR